VSAASAHDDRSLGDIESSYLLLPLLLIVRCQLRLASFTALIGILLRPVQGTGACHGTVTALLCVYLSATPIDGFSSDIFFGGL